MTKTVGEHWVCATLARHDWAPALTRDGIARTDILAVGTLLPNRPTEWLILVLLPGLPSPPRAFVVPRDHVCAATWIAHQAWLTDPSAPEGKRNADLSRARVSLDVWHGYEDCWDLLGCRRARLECACHPGFMN